MSLTVETIIRAGAMAQSKFNMKEDFSIRIFPANAPLTVRVYEILKTAKIEGHPKPYFPVPAYDDVELDYFGSSYNFDLIRMGYSRGLNILCLALP